MDEGLNTYYQFRYEAIKYRYNSIFNESLPQQLSEKNAEEFQKDIYNALSRIPMDGAIDVPSADFPSKEQYGLVSYLKTAIWFYIMEINLGRDKIDRAIQAYFNEWKFRHPYPEDLKASFEKKRCRQI